MLFDVRYSNLLISLYLVSQHYSNPTEPVFSNPEDTRRNKRCLLLLFCIQVMGKKEKKKRSEDRFAAAETRPQFRSLQKHQSKVVLDDRFSSVLTDPRFQLEGKDKYGRGKKKQAAKEELSAFYTVEEDEKAQKEGTTEIREKPKEEHSESENEQDPAEKIPINEKDDESEDENENEDPASRIAYLTALSRGELAMSSSSEDEGSSDSSDDGEDDEEENPVYGSAGVLDPSTRAAEEVELSYEESPYLVATNLDWQNVRAVDIFAILSSFAPPGALKRVKVYQSDFGMEQMAKDKLSGPADIWKRTKVKKATDTEDEDDKSDSDENEAEDEGDNDELELDQKETVVFDESDFDPEKLRAYEASKLKYYFAVVEFAKPAHADIAYREVDGMEFEHSSSSIDLRTLPPEALDGVVMDRPMRDEATSVPSNYEPPDFIVSALQQTNVQCTWDQGDTERERKLTKYVSGEWQNLSEADELQAYLASDASSDDESDDGKAAKGAKLRKLLGLDSGDEGESNVEESDGDSSDENSASDEEGGKTLKFVPGSKSLEEKIRNKLESQEEVEEELTPWQKYQEKRKQKRKDRKQAAKDKASGRDVGSHNTESKKDRVSKAESDDDGKEDDFFMDPDDNPKKKNGRNNSPDQRTSKSSKHELELLLAGENEEEEARDYDIRGIQRMEKNKGKKLRGSRKRKEDKIAADVSGKGFKVDTQDTRFAAVLEGSDDRFGIDKTDPNYKDTSGMRKILSEQTERRKKKRRKKQGSDIPVVAPNVSVEQNAKSSGANALSALVQKLKTQVS